MGAGTEMCEESNGKGMGKREERRKGGAAKVSENMFYLHLPCNIFFNIVCWFDDTADFKALLCTIESMIIHG